MEKINLHKQELELIDGLLEIADSAMRILLAIKYSKYTSEPTLEQLKLMNLLEIPYPADISGEQVQQLIDSKTHQILKSISRRSAARNNKTEPLEEMCANMY